MKVTIRKLTLIGDQRKKPLKSGDTESLGLKLKSYIVSPICIIIDLAQFGKPYCKIYPNRLITTPFCSETVQKTNWKYRCKGGPHIVSRCL